MSILLSPKAGNNENENNKAKMSNKPAKKVCFNFFK